MMSAVRLADGATSPAREQTMMHWLWVFVIGLIVGLVAKLLMPGKDPGGCIITVLLGIAGALVAGWIGHAVGWYDTGEGAGFIAAIIGAFILLAIYRIVAGRRRA